MPDRNAPFRYRLRVWRGGHWHEFDDIYRFPPVLGELDIHPAGVFVASMPDRNAPFRYRLRVWRGGHWHEFDDIYRFPPVLGELDIHLLVEGNHLASYQKLGAHALLHDGVEGVAFAVWAPNAQRVSLVGDFNAWDGRRMPMRKRHAGGFWELFVPGLKSPTK